MVKKITQSRIAPETLSRYKILVDSVKDLELKGATMPYTSVNGNMSSFLDKEGRLALRLGPERRAEFISRFNTVLAQQYGAVLKEYVWVPESAFSNIAGIKKYFLESYQYVKGLKPKPTRR